MSQENTLDGTLVNHRAKTDPAKKKSKHSQALYWQCHHLCHCAAPVYQNDER